MTATSATKRFMALAAGTRLGPYETLSLLGSGGMGEVYRARDTKLSRAVALKILPESFTHDPERLARFRREAQVLAALNHPHIGPSTVSMKQTASSFSCSNWLTAKRSRNG